MLEYTLEIAVNDFPTAQKAVEGGADRIELCADLSEGGITPSYGMIKTCREMFNIPIFPIIRPRGGDFLYSDEEFDIMKQDISFCKEMDCDGVVFGLLKPDGNLDIKRIQKLIDLAYPMEVTFHRAFDRCKDPFAALRQLIEMGCHRLLTSGQGKTAVEGIETIRQLVQEADNQIIVMPGGGVRKENIKELSKKTGAIEFHSSLRSYNKSKMEFIHQSFTDSKESYYNVSISNEDVAELKKKLNEE